VAFANTQSATGSFPSVTYAYPSTTVTTIADALGRTWTWDLGSSGSGQFDSAKRPGAGSNSTSVTYGSGRVSSVVNNGVTTNYSRVVSGTTATTTITGTSQPTQVVVADLSLGQITKVTVQASGQPDRVTQYGYDTSGRLTSITYPEGNQTTYVPDARGNVKTTTTISKTPGTPANIVTSAAYPTSCTNTITCNKPTSTTDARLNETDYTYDPTHGGVLTITQPAVGGIQPQTRFTYKRIDKSGATSSTGTFVLSTVSACQTTASCAGAADESKATLDYGANMLPSSVTRANGTGTLAAVTALTYDGVGNTVTVDGPLTGTVDVTRYVYDADRELTETVGPDPDGAGVLKNRSRRFTFNADGQVTLAEQGTSAADGSGFVTLQQIASAYDANARKVKDSAQAGGATYAVAEYSYDAAGRSDCTTQRMNPSTFSALPAVCTLATTGSYGPDRISRNTYDGFGELARVTTAYGVTTANGFPATLQRDEVNYAYNANGTVKTLADAKNNLTTYIYDGFDRLSQTQYPSPTTPGSSNTADYEQLGYDAASNVTGRRLRGSALPAGSYDISYGYDALERLSSKTLPSPEHGVTYAYDNLGHPTTITGATTLGYGWDSLGRMTSEAQAYGSVAYQYDLANRRTRLTWQDSTYLTYDYDNVDEMTDIMESGSTILASFTYDDLGERKTRTLANGTSITYGYDPISRLTSLALAGGTNANAATLSNYSPAGEIGAHANSNDAFAWTAGITGSKAYTSNGLNQFATVVGATQGYDGRGNLTSSGGVTYAYTSENLLKTAGSATLAYDPIGRLHEYDVPTATRFVYDGATMSEELNTSGTVQRRYVFGPNGDEPIVWYEGSGTTTKRYIDQDERGSVTRITDSTGATVAVNSYDEYGIPGSANQGRFGYTGQAWLPEIGLAYYKARIYSPTLGRFLQTDPIGYADGPNWYNYVAGDPINLIDLYGLDDIVVTGSCSRGGAGWHSVNGVCVGPSQFFKPRNTLANPSALGTSFGDTPEDANDPTITCKGPVQLLAGNKNNVGREGFPGVKVRNGSAAVVPFQFTGANSQGPLLRAIGKGAFGGVAYHNSDGSVGKEIFVGIDQPVGNRSISRENIVARDPGHTVIEIVGGTATDLDALGKITVPDLGQGCPQGMTAVK
jgi:RHS repeat-associated protein